MNIREDSTIRAPSSGRDDICAKFTIDTVDEPFVLHDIAEAGQEYTLSFWCRSETDGEITAGGVDMQTSSDWTRYVVTFIADSVDVPIYFNIAGTYHIYNAQLEIGCKDTDFALNPADLEEDVEDLAVIVNNHTTQFTVMDGKIAGLIEENTTIRSEYDTLVDRTADLELTVSDFTVELESTKTTISDNYISLQEYTNTQIAAMESEISLSVANTYSTKKELETVDGKVTTLEEWQVEASQQITKEGIIATVGNYYAYQTDLEGVADRVEAAESQIIQHADEIALRVEKDGIISAINQSAEEVKIEAARITLAGATIADSFTATSLHITGDSTFDGTLSSTTGTIGGFTISETMLVGSNIELYSGSTSSEAYINLLGAYVSLPDNLKIAASGCTANCMSLAMEQYRTTYYESGDSSSSTGISVNCSKGILKLGSYMDYPAYITTTAITLDGLSGDISATGKLYFSEYGGGWYMNDSTWLRAYGNKSIYTQGQILANSNITTNGEIHVQSGIYRQGSIELYGSTPFVDFHTGSSADDFVSRIIDCGDSSAGHLRLISDRVTLTGNGYAVTIGPGFDSSNTAFLPVKSQNSQPTAADGVVYLGASASRWNRVFAVNGVVTTSDERDKNIISAIPQVYKDVFMDLKPILYTWKDFDDNATHMGLGAQTVEETLLRYGLTLKDFGAVEHDAWDNSSIDFEDGRTDRYGMNYAELSVLTIPIVQSHEWTIAEHTEHFVTVDNRLESLQDQVDYLKEVNADLRTELAEAKEEIEQLKQQVSAA